MQPLVASLITYYFVKVQYRLHSVWGQCSYFVMHNSGDYFLTNATILTIHSDSVYQA